ncbi:formylglycine-generating enzyme family protein, partial [Leclercia adecarboxylata]|uniref:formylglycine-generating enzyme family protein n=1 Tax=Leclercia adecarboxylata TaxID=83655 RepID=UPI003B42D73F
MSVFYRAGLILVTVLPLVSCDQQKQAAKVPEKSGAELSKFIAEIKENLIYVEGGEFLMGDYGEQYGPEHLPYDARQHSKPLHKVELTGYSIGKFKTSNKEYQFYLAYNNLSGRDVDLRSRTGQRWREMNMTPETPAHVDWFEAEKYCRWLATITKLPFSLPTEAQWEYAARSRGKFVIVPTDDGTIQINERKGINITTSDDRKFFARQQGTSLGILSPMPRDA